MNIVRSLALATIFAFALGGMAQTAASTPEQGQSSAHNGSGVEQHLQVLTEKLDLTADQQGKLRPILATFLEGRQKVLADSSLSTEEKHERIKAMHEKADQQVRKSLNDDQKKKLDQLEQENH
jgi:hypothetical protein